MVTTSTTTTLKIVSPATLAVSAARAFSSKRRDALEEQYKHLIEVNPDLNRQLVSFQANKAAPFYRWFKYKEGFSERMVSYLLSRLAPRTGSLLDPFAGAGAALFAARDRGWRTTGIELLPVGPFAIQARLAAERVSPSAFDEAVKEVKAGVWRKFPEVSRRFEHVSITRGAFPPQTEKELHTYLGYCDTAAGDADVRTLLRFAAYAVMEVASYTRKDGQYLRWDSRSGRTWGAKGFDKGPILPFKEALRKQLELMREDIVGGQANLFESTELRSPQSAKPELTVIEGTSLTELPLLKAKQYDFILTSPPYCNRYDYTRTYALELVFLGADEETIKSLRQSLLSCTVENKSKMEGIEAFYRKRRRLPLFQKVMTAFEEQAALQEVLTILDTLRDQRLLNNSGIARMVRNYFLEMSFTIHECAQLLRPGGWFVMVNDNVSYVGQPIPVDLILSEFARSAGLTVERIWTLPIGKGNSSQQMGANGRNELRKCVYVWRSSKAK